MDKEKVSALLGTNKDYLEEMINASPSCLKIIDKEGRLLSMNSRGIDLIEAPDFDSVLGADVYDIVHPEHKNEFIQFNKLVCSGSQGSLRFRIIGLKGTIRWMESYAAPYSLASGETAHVAITNDISEQIKNELAIKEQENIIRESSKLAELGKLAGNIAHELNNPLMILTGNARQILRTLQKEENKNIPELADYASKIQETVDRMSKIINGLKTFSHDSKEVQRKVINVDSAILEAVALSQEKFKSLGISIGLESTSDMFIQACPVQISQVLINLINNSFDAIENQDEPWIKIEVKSILQKVVISISDSGPGVPENFRHEIMNPFFTTKSVGKGTGLGLSVSLGIIKSHGGELYYNTRSKETQFIIELPMAPESTDKKSA